MKTWQRLQADPSLWGSYLVREQVLDGIRQFFKAQAFHEVQTPIMVPIPSCEPNLEVFQTKITTSHNASHPAYLIMSPEYAIKKLLAAGIGNCFEITKVFRNNEEVSRQHNSEFTMLEWYRTHATYLDVMVDFEKLFCTLVGGQELIYQGQLYNLTRPWLRITVPEAFAKYSGIDLDTLINQRGLIEVAKTKGYQIDKATSWNEVFYQIMFNEIEPELAKLNRPYFLYDYPIQQASLSKRKVSDPRLAERFEVFLAGIELGNCFTELTDAKEQEQRFIEELREREMEGKTKYPLDQDLIKALQSGLPETAGIAVGVDRLIMLIANVPTIADTMLFPQKELFDL